MASCGVIGCRTAFERRTFLEDSISFHLFPKDSSLRKKWLRAIGREGWKPFGNACVCSKHFGPKQVAYVKKSFKKLKNDAYPDVDVPCPDPDEVYELESYDDALAVARSRICRICLATNVKMFTLQKGVLQACLEAIPALYENYYFKELPQSACYICAALLLKFHNLIEKSMIAQNVILETYAKKNMITKHTLKDRNREKLNLKHSFQSHKSTPTTVFEYVYSDEDKVSVLLDNSLQTKAGCSEDTEKTKKNTEASCAIVLNVNDNIKHLNRKLVYVTETHTQDSTTQTGDKLLNNVTIVLDTSSDEEINYSIGDRNKMTDHDYLKKHAIKNKLQQVPSQQAPLQQALPQQATLQHTLPQQATLQQALPQQALPQQPTLEHTLPQQAPLQQALPQQATLQQALPQQATLQQALPQQATRQQVLPQQATLQQALPHQALLQQTLPQQALPQQAVPQQALPQQAPPLKVLLLQAPSQQAPSQQAPPQQAPPQQAPPQQPPPQQAPPQQVPLHREVKAMEVIRTQRTVVNKIAEPIIVLENKCIKPKNPGIRIEIIDSKCINQTKNNIENKSQMAVEETKNITEDITSSNNINEVTTLQPVNLNNKKTMVQSNNMNFANLINSTASPQIKWTNKKIQIVQSNKSNIANLIDSTESQIKWTNKKMVVQPNNSNIANCVINTENQQPTLITHSNQLKDLKTVMGTSNKIIIKAIKVTSEKNKPKPPDNKSTLEEKINLDNQATQFDKSIIKDDISDDKVENRKTELLNNLVSEINAGINEPTVRTAQTLEQSKDFSNETTIIASNEIPEESELLRKKLSLIVWDHFDIVELNPEQQKEEWTKSMQVPAWDNLKTHQCKECSKLFLRRPAYLNHMHIHDPKRGNVVCPVCKARFVNLKYANVHIRVTHLRQYRCRLCPSVLSNEAGARRHLQVHGLSAGGGGGGGGGGRAAPHRCRRCSFSSASRDALAAHALSHSPAHVCAHCGNGFHDAQGFLLHLRYAHPAEFMAQDPVVGEYRCEPCDINFATVGAKRVHAITSCPHKHLDDDSESEERGQSRKCTQCGAQFPTRQVLQAHLRTEHDAGRRLLHLPAPRTATPVAISPRNSPIREPNTYPLQCEHCGEMIKSRQQHWRHTNKEHPNKISTYKKIITVLCPICGKGFQNGTMLRLHELRHSRPAVQCAQCPRRFYDARGLQLHARIHSGERPWSCAVCGLAFHSRPNYERHKKVHSNETPYKCPMCDNRFKYSSSVNLHIRSVHYKMPYRKKRYGKNPRFKKLNVIVDHNNDCATTDIVPEELIEVEETNLQNFEVVGDYLIQDKVNEPVNTVEEAVVNQVAAGNNENNDCATTDIVSEELIEVVETNLQNFEVVGDYLIQDQVNEPVNTAEEAVVNQVAAGNNETFQVLDDTFEIIGEYSVQSDADKQEHENNATIEYQDVNVNFEPAVVFNEESDANVLVYDNVEYTGERILEEQVFEGCDNYEYEQVMDIDH